MKILTLEMKNFKGISELNLHLDGKSTVIFGVNGAGKTTILSAINIQFSNIINKLVHNRFKQGINIETSDIKFGAQKCRIGSVLCIDDAEIKYHRSMTRKNRFRSHYKEGLVDIYTIFHEKYLKDETQNMPIFVNYGVNRTVVNVPVRVSNKHIFNKESAFEKSIENLIDFRTFFEWFRNQEDIENEIKIRIDENYIDRSLESVRKAILNMMDGFSNIRIERNPLRMAIKKGNINLDVSQLSDGEKCTFALVGDLARRLAIANPTIENPLEGEGIVLIDEIELHMHPEWQRKVIKVLRTTFPNIQFIITTHSPQVLGEIDIDTNILKIMNTQNHFEVEKISSLIAWDSNYILEEFMEASSLNEQAKKQLAELYQLIECKEFDKAEELVDELEEKTDTAHEDVVKGRILIRRGRLGI